LVFERRAEAAAAIEAAAVAVEHFVVMVVTQQ